MEPHLDSDYKLVLVVNSELKMGKGKVAAQVYVILNSITGATKLDNSGKTFPETIISFWGTCDSTLYHGICTCLCL